MGTTNPFERVPALLLRLCRLPVAVSTVRAITEAAGATLCTVADADRARLQRELPIAPTGDDLAVMSVDGVMVPTVGGTWHEAKIVAIGRVGRDKQGEPTTLDTSYFCRMASSDDFADAATVEIHRRGIERATTVLGIADGATWCQRFFDLHAMNAVRILDFYHAVEHLGVAARAVYGEESEAMTTWVDIHRHALLYDDPATVITALATLPVERAADPADARAICERAVAYFTTRRAQIRYADFRAQGFPIGSGVVESANKLVVEDRLKGAGMHWAPDHINPMLALRGAYCSGQWRSSWEAYCESQRKRFTPVNPATITVSAAKPLAAPKTPLPPATTGERPKMFEHGKPTQHHPWKKNSACPRTLTR